ncbi:MAG TPA: hypothetical protein VGC30_11020 [Dokdonella sp.]
MSEASAERAREAVLSGFVGLFFECDSDGVTAADSAAHATLQPLDLLRTLPQQGRPAAGSPPASVRRLPASSIAMRT